MFIMRVQSSNVFQSLVKEKKVTFDVCMLVNKSASSAFISSSESEEN